MTGRVCPVHGEYAADGICRWCEPASSALDFPLSLPKGVVRAVFEAHLLAQHAALRWERVARRWNYKHRRAGGLSERDRNRVWMHWLDQQERRYLRITWKPGEPP